MRDDWSRPVSDGPEGDTWLAEAQPDLGSLREAAERGELPDAVACLAGTSGFRLGAGDDPLAPLAREVARALTLAGFAVHHCVRADPLYRLGGVCLLPVSPWSEPGGETGVAVSWRHSLLSLDWGRWAEYRGVLEAMNQALAGVLGALGFCVQPFGQGGASLVTGRRDRNEPGAGR